MSVSQNEEIVPEKELLQNFKIPKKRKLEEEPPIENGQQQFYSMDITQNVLANSYYNYPQYQQMGVYGGWPNAGYYEHCQPGPSQYGEVAAVAGEPITQKIYNTLMEHKEKPKTYTNNIFKRTVPDADDESLPKELTMLFQPLYCKLCSTQLSSNVMAKLHYKSKNHEKKIKKFLIEYSERTGEPLHKRAKVTNVKTVSEDENDPRYFHCDICDLPLTGKLHAESHYMGKNHQKAVCGYKNPAGKGYYDDQGKWVRVKATKKSETTYNGDDNFGLDFRPKVPEVVEQKVEPGPAMMPSPKASLKFHCDVCNVGTTCQQQLEMHYQGQKHLKKMRQMGLAKNEGDANKIQGLGADKSQITEKNLAAYRTPSGNYYCQICNLTLNAVQFKIHLTGKNHYKKATQQKS